MTATADQTSQQAPEFGIFNPESAANRELADRLDHPAPVCPESAS